MAEKNLFPDFKESSTKLLIINQEVEQYLLTSLANDFRFNGIVTELYPDQLKLKKQLKYANAIEVPYVLFCSSNADNLQLELKDMNSEFKIKWILVQWLMF